MAEPLPTQSQQQALRQLAANAPDAVEAYLEQYKPEHTLFRWTGACSFAVPFDKIMWKVRAAKQYAADRKHGAAARLLRSALTEDFARWTHRGAEATRCLHEPNVYALYCRERGMAALAACKQAPPSETVARLASYAALMLGTACRLRPAQEKPEPAYEAAGCAYDKLGEHLVASGDHVGAAVGAFLRAQQFYDRSGAGTTCRLRWAQDRNSILSEQVTVPPLPVPHCLGGPTTRRAADA